MIIKRFALTPFQQNTRVVSCVATRAAICIDPGEASSEIVEYINANELRLQAIALTHGHLDHVGGTRPLRGSFPDAEIILHRDDEDLYYGLPQQPLFMGIQPHQMESMGLKYDEPLLLTRNWEH
ncbi:MAG TPA: MBL fold metallo-hydrolase, partial [Pyrinomonadaceae bacterium]|nr:MBL fold metallo-hydrolase [Pyrinomonadaceae bacterium]